VYQQVDADKEKKVPPENLHGTRNAIFVLKEFVDYSN
jgi:hypothetical protein